MLVSVVHEIAELAAVLQDDIIAGRLVPKDTILAFSIYALHNSPHNWEHPREFNPDRFASFSKLSSSSAFCTRHWHGLAFRPFSGTPRNCLGQHLAWSVPQQLPGC